MKKIGVLIVSAVLLAGCMKGSGGTTGTSNAPGGAAGGGEQFSGTLKAAMALGVPMKCTYKVNDIDFEGYVQGTKYRGKMMQEGKMTNVIMTDSTMYLWQEGASQGMKTTYDMEEMEETAQSQETSDMQSFSRPDVEYKCLPTVVSAGTFTPPSNVNFMDLDSLMQGNATEEQMQQMEQMAEEYQ